MYRAMRSATVILIVILAVGVVSASECSVECYKEKIKELNETIAKLKAENEELKNQNIKLEAELSKLKSQYNQLKDWDVRELMDKLTIFHYTDTGKRYDLIFHYGGFGGVTVYQYVGVGLGDAGKFRQYKQISFYKGEKGSTGFEKPGIVLHPVWGFNESTITVRSISDIIKLENELNNINGLTKYVGWLREKYIESSNYNAGGLIAISGIMIAIGLLLGEMKMPVRRAIRWIEIRTMTDFGEKKKSKNFLFVILVVALIVVFGVYSATQDILATVLTTFVFALLILTVGERW